MRRLVEHRLRPLVHWPSALLVAMVVVGCLLIQREGHDWGDDFALYVRQAQGIVDGNPAAVVADNRFALDNSSWSTFSPEAYPWGWPLLMAPLVSVFGLDYTVTKWLCTLFFAIFLLTLHRIVEPRVGRWSGLAITAMVGFSVPFVGSTDTVLSEMPYVAFVGLTLRQLDKCSATGRLTGSGWPAIRSRLLVGALVAIAISVRREGVALVGALIVAQVVGLRHQPHIESETPDLKPAPLSLRLGPTLSALSLPHLVSLVLIGSLETAMPGPFGRSYSGAGFAQVGPNLRWYMGPLAEQVGLRDAGAAGPGLFGFALIGHTVLAGFVILSAIGLLVPFVGRRFAADAPMAVFVLGSGLVIAMQPFREGRYLFAVTPFLGYFAVRALPAIGAVSSGRQLSRCASLAGSMMATALAVATFTDTRLRIAQTFASDHTAVWGPESAASKDMFAKVRFLTGDNEVVAFHRARAMALYTGRRSVQLLDAAELIERADWYVRVKDPADYSQVPLTHADAAVHGITMVWQNDAFELWRMARSD